MRKVLIAMVLMTASLVRAESNVEVKGSGKTGAIAYGETVTGTIEVSEASDIQSISFVGHNGQNRRQGDFDVWYFDAQQADNLIIRVNATDGNFAPTILVTFEDKTSGISSVVNWDGNVDGDAEAGVCLRNIPHSQQYAIVVFRQEAMTGNYSLSLEKVASVGDLSGGSETAVCSVGSFVVSRGDYVINIRANPGKQFRIKDQMQPGQLYSFYSAGGDWTQIAFVSEESVSGIAGGYVSTPLVVITGTAHQTNEEATPEP
jgi:hypothetical protein